MTPSKAPQDSGAISSKVPVSERDHPLLSRLRARALLARTHPQTPMRHRSFSRALMRRCLRAARWLCRRFPLDSKVRNDGRLPSLPVFSTLPVWRFYSASC